MRTALLFLLFPLACGRRDRVVETPPSAVGGGPRTAVIPASDARSAIARSRCTTMSACAEFEMDACITREEAALSSLSCAVDPARLDECLERTRTRACTASTALSECAGETLCPKENQ